jgi:alpha-beta hydrolase superfamily lysophospholipase
MNIMRMRRRIEPALPLLIGGFALAAFELGRRVYRHTQIFCPDRNPTISWDPADYGIPEGAVEEHWIDTPDGEVLHAWYCRAKNPKASGVFCHGNTGNITISAHVIPHLLNAGFNVLFFDYRGFGKSTGVATYRGVIADGVTASRFHDQIRPQHLPSVLYGFSLGGGVAAQVIRRHKFDGLILQSTFTSLPQITRVLFPRLPLHWFAGDLFNTLAVVKQLQVPLLLMHGTADEVIPCWMGHEIFGACPTEKKLHIVDGGLHKNLYLLDPDTLTWQISQFIADLPHNHRKVSVEETPAIEQWTDTALRTLRRAFR